MPQTAINAVMKSGVSLSRGTGSDATMSEKRPKLAVAESDGVLLA